MILRFAMCTALYIYHVLGLNYLIKIYGFKGCITRSIKKEESKMNNEIKMMPIPPGFSQDILENENLCRRYGDIVSAYNPEHSIGAMYYLVEQQWTIFYPIDFVEFADNVAAVVSINEEMQAEQTKLN
nr:hypothetical protein 5 [Gammaproteobacteria bacterium]